MKTRAIHALAGAILILAAGGALAAIEGPPSMIDFASRTGIVQFDHQAHAGQRGVTCVACHHTGQGERIGGGCRGCHPAQKAAGKLSSREAFHKQCIGCHKAREKQGQAAGPAKACSGCHKR